MAISWKQTNFFLKEQGPMKSRHTNLLQKEKLGTTLVTILQLSPYPSPGRFQRKTAINGETCNGVEEPHTTVILLENFFSAFACSATKLAIVQQSFSWTDYCRDDV